MSDSASSPTNAKSKDAAQQRDNQPGKQVRRPVLPAPTDMFPTTTQGLETPERVYVANEDVQNQQVDTVPIKQGAGSSTGHSRASNIQYHIAGAPILQSPKSSVVNSQQQQQSRISPSHRAGEVSVERNQQQKGRTTLVPNFRSISPSIFNIDLNQTVGKGDQVPGAQASPNSNSNRNQIYVSIQSKRNETETAGQPGPHGHGNSYSQSMRVRRIGPLQNKGDKIKFGVLISRESKRKAQQQSIDFLQPHEIFETPKQLIRQGRVAIGKHSETVIREINKYPTYTTSKTLPMVLVNKHKNIVKQFEKNFTRETDAFERHSHSMASRMVGGAQSTTVGAGGYFTETDTMQTRIHGLKRGLGDQLTGARQSKKSFWSDDNNLMSIRDVIEEHAKSVAALKKSFRPSLYLEIDEKRRKRNREIEEKGRQIAQDLNISPKTCGTRASRFYRGLTDEQPIRQHNKPLTHMLRPNQKLVIERAHNKEEQRQKKLAEEKQQLKRRMQGLSLSAMQTELKSGIATVQRGTQLRKETLKAMKDEETKYKKRMRSRRSKDDWEQHRKDIEESIDNGMTFSHLSRVYPMKREWAKYLVLLRKKEVDRRKKERKVREIMEDLQDRGVVDEKQIANELDLFEYQEFKKRKDRNKARMGVKAEAKYYRPVDTDRTLKIEPISMDLTDDYDDGPGGFKLEDFEGIETMFSKQSLEQRKIRVDRARERLREKRLKKLEQAKFDAELLKQNQMHPVAPQKTQGEDLIEVQQQSFAADPQQQAFVTQQNNLMPQQVQQQMQVPPIQMQQFMNAPHVDTFMPGSNINVDDQTQTFTRTRQRGRYDQRGSLPGVLKRGQQDPSLIGRTPTPDETGRLGGDRSGMDKTSDDRTIGTIGTDRKDAIRVEIASGTGQARNLPHQQETLKTTSQIREYSLEDGGIFEKKTLAANTSIEDPKLVGESITQGSLEMLPVSKSHTSSDEQVEAQSQKQIQQTLSGQPGQVKEHGRRTQVRTVTTHEDHAPADKETEMMEDEEVVDPIDVNQQEVMIPLSGSGDQKIDEFLQPRIRPSTTENVRRIVMNRRRQLMSGYNKNEQHLRGSLPDANGQQLLSRQHPQSTQKSAGMITTVHQQNQRLRMNAMAKMVNQSSSFANQVYQGGVYEAGTTSTGLNTDGRPSNAFLSGSGANRGGPGTTTLRDSGTQGQILAPFSGTGGPQTSLTGTRTQSGATGPSVMENWRSEHKKIIWKEILKHKEELEMSGDEKISRNIIKTIRNRIRRERRKRAKREGFASQKYMSDTNVSDSHLISRRVTMKNIPRPSDLSPIAAQVEKTVTTRQTQPELPRYTQSDAKSGFIPEMFDSNSDHQIQIQGNAQIAQRQSTAPQLIPINGQSRINQQQFTQQQVVDRNYFGVAGDSNTGGATTTYEDKTSTDELTRTLTATLDARPNAQDQSEFVLGPPPNHRNQGASYMTVIDREQNSIHGDLKKNFVEYNRSCVRENSLKMRIRTGKSRLPRMRGQMRHPESLYQSRLQENQTKSALMFNQKTQLGLKTSKLRYPASINRLKSQAQMYAAAYYQSSTSASQMFTPFQEQLMDRRSIQNVFNRNQLEVDPDIDNEFSRQQAWNETLNCPYYGLMSLRQTQDRPINSKSREENILIPFTMGNKQERRNIKNMDKAVMNRNKLREMDRKMYSLIELCEGTKKIHWKQIYEENEDFRNDQRKKAQNPPQVTVEELMDLVKQ